MFSGYEQFWSAMLDDYAAVVEMLGRDPYPREIAYAEVASKTEHLVLLDHAHRRHLAERTDRPFDRGDPHVQARRPRHAHVVGGPTLVTNLLEAGLLDELRLIVHPILIGAGQGITGVLRSPQRLELVATGRGGGATLTYRLPRVR